MAITQIIATLPAVLNDSETFYEDIAVRNNSLVTVSFPSINTWATQANALAVEVNDKAAQVAAQAVDGGYSQTYINTNFVDVNNAQNITEVKTFTVSPIVPTPTTDYQVANKKYIDDNNKINTLTSKTTPVDADELVIADSASSFSLKKLSFTNLKATLLTYFDTLYSRTNAVFGISQTWQDVTASRSAGVTYTNSTGKPIMISIYNTLSLNVVINGVTVGKTICLNSVPTISFIVPNGSTYLVTGTFSALLWSELR